MSTTPTKTAAHYLPLMAASLMLISSLDAAPPEPYGATPTRAQIEWHKLEQYAFCHFTINTFTGKEWGYGDESPQLFNPTGFDADQIVLAAKSAGMKAFILTCKHHDGFCLWPTKTTKHNISASPWKNGKGDLVKEFADASRRHGLKFGVYLSPWDRNNEHYGTPDYIKIFRAQLTELLTNYGEVFEVWFDGANGGDGFYGGKRETRKIDRLTYYDWPGTWKLAESIQPQAVIMSDIGPGVRWIGNEHGHAKYPCWATFTPEGRNGNPPGIGESKYQLNEGGTADGKYWIPGECDVSIRPGWFYHENQNSKVRTPANLLDLYFASVGRGASFLLNLPPSQKGQMHPNDVYALKGYGEALQKLFAKNYTDGSTATASVTRNADAGENFSPSQVLDDSASTYWATPDGTKQASLTIELDGAQTFDVIRLREPIALGQRIRKFNVEVKVNGQWQPWVTNGSSIGAHTLFRENAVTATTVRVNITESAACPLLSEVSLWKLPANVPNTLPAVVKPGTIAKNTWRAKAEFESAAHPAHHAVDGNPNTFWCTHDGTARKHNVPQTLTIDLGKTETFSAVEVTPRQDGIAHAVVDRYRIQWSTDGKSWSPAIEGEFSNIRNNPIAQTVELKRTVNARYLKFTALRVLEKDNVTVAEITLIKPRK